MNSFLHILSIANFMYGRKHKESVSSGLGGFRGESSSSSLIVAKSVTLKDKTTGLKKVVREDTISNILPFEITEDESVEDAYLPNPAVITSGSFYIQKTSDMTDKDFEEIGVAMMEGFKKILNQMRGDLGSVNKQSIKDAFKELIDRGVIDSENIEFHNDLRPVK